MCNGLSPFHNCSHCELPKLRRLTSSNFSSLHFLCKQNFRQHRHERPENSAGSEGLPVGLDLHRHCRDHQDWNTSPDCIKIYESQCDLTNYLTHLDRSYTADIQTEMDYDTDENFPHTLSPVFNPYRESEISAVSFTVDTVEDDKVMLHITDPLSGIHRNRKHLTIRDILKTDLKYKISYYKAGSTGKRDIISDSNVAEVSNLDAGQSYCFMVAAYIPSRPKANQLGAWSKQQCTAGHTSILQDLSIGALIGVLFILLVVIIVFIIVTVLCCKCCRKRSDQRSSAV
ncbi:tissue factor-like isoform X1 [Thalassophryne amazonica]|uniref:tissue factor-like isoform X1 n=1 Tax=Thalassophryne amazonica TaxID=390379 RepID=UPI00147193C9|nr:tissue factor-like isoform X1 [Thalassophryne amazonica]